MSFYRAGKKSVPHLFTGLTWRQATDKTGPHAILMAFAQIRVLHSLLAVPWLYMPHKFLA